MENKKGTKRAKNGPSHTTGSTTIGYQITKINDIIGIKEEIGKQEHDIY